MTTVSTDTPEIQPELKSKEFESGRLFISDNVALMKALPGGSIDLTVTSPPYDDMRTYTGESHWSLSKFGAIAKELFRVTKDGGVVVWNVADKTKDGAKSCSSFRHVLGFVEAGFSLADTMIWEKSGTSLGSNRLYHSNYEFMFILAKGRHSKFNPIRDRLNKVSGPQTAPNPIKNGKTSGGRRQIVSGEFGKRNNIWRIVPEQNRVGHPAPFPLALANDHILSWTDIGDVVFDPFMGSGTTACAAVRTGRSWVGAEISEEYASIAEQHILTAEAERHETLGAFA